MLYLALFLTFLCGYAIISRISEQFNWLERIGMAFPIGLGVISFAMMLLDWANIPLTGANHICLAIFVCILAYMPYTKSFKWKQYQPSCKWKFDGINGLWMVLMVLLVYVEYCNWIKCLYFPTFDRDSLAGFDTLGYIAAQEHTYSGMSVFQGDYMPRIHQAGSCIAYIPMLQMAYAFAYSFGAQTTKLIPALFYLSFILGLYGVTRRATNPTSAALATLGMVCAPEMLSFSSLSATNVMHAAVASVGLIYVLLWMKNGERRDLILGMVLLAVNHWIRNEGVVFGASAGLLVLIQCIRRKCHWLWIALPVATLLPTLLFQIYANVKGLSAEAAIVSSLVWDGEKMGAIAIAAVDLISNIDFYGLSFAAMALAFLVNIVALVKKGDCWTILCAFLVSYLLYFGLLYIVDYKWDSLDNVLNYSAKRFLFCFVPLAWYYFVSASMVQKGISWIERTCGIRYQKK